MRNFQKIAENLRSAALVNRIKRMDAVAPLRVKGFNQLAFNDYPEARDFTCGIMLEARALGCSGISLGRLYPKESRKLAQVDGNDLFVMVLEGNVLVTAGDETISVIAGTVWWARQSPEGVEIRNGAHNEAILMTLDLSQ